MATDRVTRRILCFEYQNVLELACMHCPPWSCGHLVPPIVLSLLLRGDTHLFHLRYIHT